LDRVVVRLQPGEIYVVSLMVIKMSKRQILMAALGVVVATAVTVAATFFVSKGL
jgi:hypothetical protein